MQQDGMLLTVPQVAERLQVSEWTVRDWLRKGQLRGVRLGGTRIGWRVSEADLRRFIDSRASGGERTG